MKKGRNVGLILGIVGTVFFLIGMLFKFMLWPGAGINIMAAIVLWFFAMLLYNVTPGKKLIKDLLLRKSLTTWNKFVFWNKLKSLNMRQLLLALLFIPGINSSAQPYYFLQDTASYEPLSNSTSINNGIVWSGFQTFSIPIGFTFDFMDASFTTVDLEATGRLIFDPSHFYFADMLVAQGLQDKGTSSSQSPLSYELTGTAGNQILKIEVNNAEYAGDPGSTINFQIWLYEYTSRLELHMGPVSINDPGAAFGLGPSSGVYHITLWSPLTYAYGLLELNDPLNPDDTTFSGTGINTTGLSLNNAPPEGHVYIYTVDTSFLELPNSELSTISVYPNPFVNELNITGINEGWIIIQSIAGELVLEESLDAEKIQLNSLSKGSYIISITDLNKSEILFRQVLVK